VGYGFPMVIIALGSIAASGELSPTAIPTATPGSGWMDWLNDHASGIQAIAALVTVVTTVVLACITYRYVKLTRTLASSAEEQIRFLRAERETRRMRFW
jgi:ammonia channel protein AmtB